MNHEQSNHRNMHSLKIYFHSSPFTNEKKKGELVHIFINAIKTLTFVIVNGEGCKFMRKKNKRDGVNGVADYLKFLITILTIGFFPGFP